MTGITSHERPGVYSVYTASKLLSGSGGNGTAALVGKCRGGNAGELYRLYSYAAAAEAFGEDDGLTRLAELLLRNGAAQVLAVPLEESAGTEAYQEAFQRLEQEEGIKVLLCDSLELEVQTALRESVERASGEKRERLGVAAGPEGVSALTARAEALNCERMVLTAPGGAAAAAAVAGAICALRDPAVPLGGAALLGVGPLEGSFQEAELDTLLRGGVTPVEIAGGRCQVVRGVSTRTKSGGVRDETWRDLGTILVIDDVIPAIREQLQARFARSKNTAQVRGAIRSQVILMLEEKLAAEIITGYDGVTAQALEEDAAVCLVSFAFTVAHGLNQIWLKAQITV